MEKKEILVYTKQPVIGIEDDKNFNIDDLIQELQDRQKEGATHCAASIDIYDDYIEAAYFKFYTKRIETNDEFEHRCKYEKAKKIQDEKYAKAREARKYQEYLELKKKYEG